MSRKDQDKKFHILAFREGWGGHRTVITATSAELACAKYIEDCKEKFPVEWIAEVTNE